MKATIKQISTDTVRRTLPAGHPLNDSFDDTPIIQDYWVPTLSSGRPGYVTLVTDTNHGTLGEEVCEYLDLRGYTLMAKPSTLLQTIRDEHRKAMRRKLP